jgi:hypothetical protein
MSILALKYLGLSEDGIFLLQKLIRQEHPVGGMQTASSCPCGRGSGGPAGSQACRILERLIDAGDMVRLGRPTHKDVSICTHELNGKLTVWEYEGKLICEQCCTALT